MPSVKYIIELSASPAVSLNEAAGHFCFSTLSRGLYTLLAIAINPFFRNKRGHIPSPYCWSRLCRLSPRLSR